jgi:PIN domain nuclease of toxin-antitoxin system
LAYLNKETGAQVVEPAFENSSISAVNYSELVQKLTSRSIDPAIALNGLIRAGMTVEPFSTTDAEVAASLYQPSAQLGLSLADRACLALGKRLEVPVMTADRVWAQLLIGVEIVLIR